MGCAGRFSGGSTWLRTSLILTLISLATLSAWVQWEPAFTLQSPEPDSYGYFGYSVAGVPDVDGDGIWDLVVGAYGEQDARRVHLLSGATGQWLRTLRSPSEKFGGHFGYSISGSEDMDGDGFGDIIVDAPWEDPDDSPRYAGRVHIFSGATGTLIRTVRSPDEMESGLFGLRVLSTPDYSGDGIADLLVTSQRVDVGGLIHSGGWVHLLSGATGELITAFVSPNEEDFTGFGEALCIVPDVNGDGVDDILIGAPQESPGTAPDIAGRAYLFSGATGALIQEFQSPEEDDEGHFGAAVSTVADLDGDGITDLAIGAPSEELTGEPSDAGHVHLFSGATGGLIETLRPGSRATSGLFGSALTRVPDVNEDNRDELAVGAYGVSRVFLFSGATATLMVSHTSPDHGDFGKTLAAVPDLNGDGRGDLLVGARRQHVDPVPWAGRAYLFHGPPFPQFYPEIEVSVSEIDLGDQSIVEPETATVTITSRGTADLTFTGSGVTLQGLTPEDFVFTSPPDTSPLNPWLSREIQIALSSLNTGFKEAELVITTDDFDESEVRIPISAVATHPEALYPEIPRTSIFVLDNFGDTIWLPDYHVDLAHGDIDGDGHDDLIVGYPDTGVYALDAVGAVSVVYGQSGMAGANLNLESDGVPSARETRIIGGKPNAFLGWAVASGDINGDGFDDVVMGAPREDPAAGEDAGKVYIIYGRDTLPGEIMILAVAPGVYGETQIHGFQGGENLGETLGSAFAVGDFNADGFDDVAIGAPWSSPWNRHWAGRVYVIWGRADLPGKVLDLHDGVGTHGETRIIAEWFEDNLGEELAAGDVDGDGLDDLIIGARMGDPLARVDAGRGYVVYGSALPPGLELDLRTARPTPERSPTFLVMKRDHTPERASPAATSTPTASTTFSSEHPWPAPRGSPRRARWL
jgi:FG-GAP repeat protein